MAYKLNELGEKVWNKWDILYLGALERLREEKNDPEFVDGWGIFYDVGLLGTEEEFVEMLVWAHADNIFNYLGDLWYDERDDALYEKRRKLALKYFDFWDTSVYERGKE